MPQFFRLLIIFSVERKTNINIFLSACRKSGVRSSFKNSDAIEKLDITDWAELLKTLQSLSRKVETHTNRPSFRLDDKAIRNLIDQAKQSDYSDANYEIYGSPYQQTSNTEELYDRYNRVSCAKNIKSYICSLKCFP